MIITETERLIIREFTADDAEEMFRIHSDPVTMRFQNSGPDDLEHERQTLMKHAELYYRKRGFGIWGVVRKDGGRLIGRCGLIFQEIDSEERLEVSYLIDRGFCGNGYATEAVKAVLDIALKRFGIDKLVAIVANENAASVRVAEKCGFTVEKELGSYKKFTGVSLYSKRL